MAVPPKTDGRSDAESLLPGGADATTHLLQNSAPQVGKATGGSKSKKSDKEKMVSFGGTHCIEHSCLITVLSGCFGPPCSLIHSSCDG